jgi:hypothetical protein
MSTHRIIMAPLSTESSNDCSTMSTQNTMSTPQTVGRRQRVAFVPYVDVVSIPDRSEFTKEEVQAAWYNCRDLLGFKARVRTTIGLLSSNGAGASCDGEGLETKDECMERRTRILESRFAVFFEQESQWEDDIDDPESITDLYFDYTCYSQCLAQERAATLAKHVQEINRPVPQKTYAMTSKQASSNVCFIRNKNLVVLSPMKRRSVFPAQTLVIKSPFSTQGTATVDFIDRALSIVVL